MTPAKEPSEERPRPTEVKRYGGKMRIDGEMVEMRTILRCVNVVLQYILVRLTLREGHHRSRLRREHQERG